MAVRGDIITELMAEPITKIDRKPSQSDLDNLENELAKSAMKIENTKDIVKNGKEYGFY